MQEKSLSSARQVLENIMPLAQQSIDEVRRIIMDLRPSILDHLGLIATISWFCREFESIYADIHIGKEIQVEEKDIPEGVKTAIYRIMQEALNNAAKYSRAEVILLKLARKNGVLELLIEDHGSGFDIKNIMAMDRDMRGMGLVSMKERALLTGGSFDINSYPGKGTKIHITWPLRE
jgi:signal transduction histidine kinase